MVQTSFKRRVPGYHDKRGTRRKHVSVFLITLNTNIRMGVEEARGHTDPLYDMAEGVFLPEARLKELVSFPRGGSFTDDTIESVKSDARVEIGHNNRGARLHLHVGLKIFHWSFIRLDPKRIKEMANEELTKLDSNLRIHHVNISVHKPSPKDYLSL